MLGPAGIGGDKRQVDVGFHGRGKLHFGLFRRFLEPLQSHFVTAQIDTLVFFEFSGQIIDQAQVEILSAQMRVAVGGLDLENAFTDLKHRNIESAAAQIEHGDLFFTAFVKSIGQRGGRRFIDDAQHVQPRDLAGILGRLALTVIEIGRNRNDGIGYGFPQIILRVLFDVRKNK